MNDKMTKYERIAITYYCASGHENALLYSAAVETDEIPVEIDCPNCGAPSGQDKENPPTVAKHEPYKTHLAYVKERRTEAEAKALLEEALASIKARRTSSVSAEK